jgi:hypothetical protein
MELNMIASGIRLIGSTIKNLKVDNNIVDVDKECKRSFGLNINEPEFQSVDNRVAAQMTIDFEVEIIQAEEQRCKIEISLEGAFLSEAEPIEDEFKQLVAINGAAAIIGLARGKLEAITANIFNNGKISIPFVNVLDYYRGQ